MGKLLRKNIVWMLSKQSSGPQAQKVSQKAQQLWNNTGAAFQDVSKFTASQKLVGFLKIKEGWVKHKTNPHLASLYNDSVNHCTVGYGTLVHKGPCSFSASDPLEKPYLNGITLQHAEQLLLSKVAVAETDVKKLLTGTLLTQHMYDAYISLLYNIGGTNADPTWNVFTQAMKGNYNNAAKEFLDIVKASGKVQPGLVIRRREERDMLLFGIY